MMSVSTLGVSIGTAMVLGLRRGRALHPPTTAYIMLGDRCSSNCSFCAQARDASASERLSRVTWPRFDTETVIASLASAMDSGISRICVQVLGDGKAISGLPDLVRKIRFSSDLPLSISIIPIPERMMIDLRDAGAERIGIALDAPSERIFDEVKGRSRGNPFTFEGHWHSLERAVEIFGMGNVSTHLIVGMGETDRELYDAMNKARSLGVSASLFAFTPVKGGSGPGSPPPVGRYRAMQILRHLIFDLDRKVNGIEFDEAGKMTNLDNDVIEDGPPNGWIFATRGCPDCNRPYYTESPMGPIYNHPEDPGPDKFFEGIELAKRYLAH